MIRCTATLFCWTSRNMHPTRGKCGVSAPLSHANAAIDCCDMLQPSICWCMLARGSEGQSPCSASKEAELRAARELVDQLEANAATAEKAVNAACGGAEAAMTDALSAAQEQARSHPTSAYCVRHYRVCRPICKSSLSFGQRQSAIP